MADISESRKIVEFPQFVEGDNLLLSQEPHMRRANVYCTFT